MGVDGTDSSNAYVPPPEPAGPGPGRNDDLARGIQRSRSRFSWRQVLVLLVAAYLQLVGADTVRALVIDRTFTGSVVEPLEAHRTLAWPVAVLLMTAGTWLGAFVLARRDGTTVASRLAYALVGGGLIYLTATAMSAAGGVRTDNTRSRTTPRRDVPSVAGLAADRALVTELLGGPIEKEDESASRAFRSSTKNYLSGKQHVSVTVRPLTARQLSRLESAGDPARRIGVPIDVGKHACTIAAGSWQVQIGTSVDLTDPARRATAHRLLETVHAALAAAG